MIFFLLTESMARELKFIIFVFVLTKVIAASSVKQPSYLGQGHVGDQIKLYVALDLSAAVTSFATFFRRLWSNSCP